MPEAMERVRKKKQDEPVNIVSSNGKIITIDNDTGDVYFDDPPNPNINRGIGDNSGASFGMNLAEGEAENNLAGIANDCLTGIAQDILSRSEFIANYNRGIDLLGLKIEEASRTRGSTGTISKSKHPALLESCVKYQAGARGELLSAQGPVKIATIGGDTDAADTLAKGLEDDFNFYLTDVATEYYPDTDRSLFHQAFGGSFFKKVYQCPRRRRPVSESVYLTNLIVSEDATDLANAIRVTNEILVSNSELRRMQIGGAWKDVNLGYPSQTLSPARRKILETQGIVPSSTRPQDNEFTIYECYCDLDPADYGIHEPNAPERLPLPYRVTVEKDSQQILGLHRDWKRGDELFTRRKTFVKFGLIPGLGFLDYGFLHLIGNQTRVLTAILQLLIDSGMLANFPGGMRVKGIRTSTNEVNPGVGEFVEMDIGAMTDIRQAIMALPYKDISPGIIQIYQFLEQSVMRMGSSANLETGEGRTNIPVGTIMAMIEQQTQVLGAIHKRNFTAQKEEFMLLRELIADDPKCISRPGRHQWTREEIMSADLAPAADPNVPAQMHRIMLASGLEQMAAADPVNFKRREIHARTLRMIGINDIDDILITPQEAQQVMVQAAAKMMQQMQGQQGGKGAAGSAALQKTQLELPLKQQELAIEQQRLQNEQQINERQAANEAADVQERTAERQGQEQIQAAELQIERDKLAVAQAEAAGEAQMSPIDQANLRKTNAQAFSAMGQGAAGFAQAQQTTQQGDQDLASLDADLAGQQFDQGLSAAELDQTERHHQDKMAVAKKAAEKPAPAPAQRLTRPDAKPRRKV
jgi:hypothetical protein